MHAFTKAAAIVAATASLATALPATAAVQTSPAARDFVAPTEQVYHNGRDRYDDRYRGRYERDDWRRGYRTSSRDYGEPVYRNTRTWRGNDGRYYCRKNDGTTGLLIGGAAGAVAGNLIDGGRNRTLGTIIGALGGALIGSEIEKGESRCR